MKVFFKIISLIFSILFLVAVYIQHNDPDPVLWYFIYGLAAIVSFMFFIDKLKYSPVIILATLYFIAIFIFLPQEFEGIIIGNGNSENIELARESLGLLIISILFSLYAWRIKVGR